MTSMFLGVGSNGKLVALSTGESLYNSTLAKLGPFIESRLSAADSTHRSVRLSASILSGLDWPIDYYSRSESTTDGFEFHTKALTSHGFDWLVVAGKYTHTSNPPVACDV